MERTRKEFDCVEMKEEIQQKIRSDYDLHKCEFGTYKEYIEARIKKNPWASAMMAEISKSGAKTVSR